MRKQWREEVGNLSVEGSKRAQRPLLQVRATRLRAWASLVEVRSLEILTERKREATPPIPIALTVFETVQYAENPLGWVKAMSTIAGRVAHASRSLINAGSLLI